MNEILNQYKFECLVEIVSIIYRDIFSDRWLLESGKKWENNKPEYIEFIKSNTIIVNQLSDHDKRSIETGNITNWSLSALTIILTSFKYQSSKINKQKIDKENNIIQKLFKTHNLIRSEENTDDENIKYLDIKNEMLEYIQQLSTSSNGDDKLFYFTKENIENILNGGSSGSSTGEVQYDDEIYLKYFSGQSEALKLLNIGIEYGKHGEIVKECETYAKALEVYSESISFELKSKLHLNLSIALLVRYKSFSEGGKDNERVYTIVYKQFLNLANDNAKYSLSFNPSNPINYYNLSDILTLEGDYGISCEFLKTAKQLSTSNKQLSNQIDQLLNYVENKLVEYEDNCKNSNGDDKNGLLTFDYKSMTLKHVLKNRFKVTPDEITAIIGDSGEELKEGTFKWYINELSNGKRTIETLYELAMIYTDGIKDQLEKDYVKSNNLLFEASLKSVPTSTDNTSQYLGQVHSELGFRFFNGFSGVDIDIERSHYHLRESTKYENSTGYHLITLVGLEKGILSIKSAISVLDKGVKLDNENCKRLSSELIDLEKKQNNNNNNTNSNKQNHINKKKK